MSEDQLHLSFSRGAEAVRSADMGDRVRAPKREFRQSTPAELEALFNNARARGRIRMNGQPYAKCAGRRFPHFGNAR